MAFAASGIAILAVLAASVDGRYAHAADPTAKSTPTPEGIEFFEKNVRPVLTEHCLECHGAEKQESGLRLDSRAAVLAGGEIYGPAIEVGDPTLSVLIKAIGHGDDDIQMPPEEKLPDSAIQALEHWVAIGAPWPAEPSTAGPTSESGLAAAWASHWAAQPIINPPLPELERNESALAPIDAYVLERLEQDGLTPSPAADRRTLIRRATYDLTGLPPTLAEIEDFLSDESSPAFAKVVDRLLDSPHYGERWARYWLDVARYADTKGYVRLQEDPIYHYAYTYRDYVVRSFNEDLPYDRFVVEQLAADQLDLGDDNRALAALGFLALGRRFTGNKHDIIDDRIDVVTRGLLGLTVTCTRCHDHKYDPITTADYYSLYGVFASTREPADLPIIGVGQDKPLFDGEIAEYRAQQETLDQLQEEHHEALLESLRAATTDYLVRMLDGRQPFLVPMPPKTGEIRQNFVERWIDYIQSTSGRDDMVFAPWHALVSLDASTFVQEAPEVIKALSDSDDGRPANALVLDALGRDSPASMTDVARTYGQLLTDIHHEWQAQVAADPQTTALADEAAEQLRQVLYAADSPFAVTSREATADYLYDAEINKTLAEAQSTFDAWLLATGHAADRAHALIDAPTPNEPRIFVRGNPERPGPLVRRQFLGLLSDEPRTSFQHGSGRLELARAITDRENPLTARVLVNRIWQHHFGSGLVTTPSNFGLRGDAPSHPDLLDYLARSFIDEGWSIKKLHRRIMLTGTYQQASLDRPQCRQVDPENRLLWRMNRRRLDFEALRDSLLCVSGELDLSVGGPPSPLMDLPNNRRTIYGTIDRLNMPGVLRTFDFPTPDLHSPARAATTVAQQALFFLNSSFVIDRAESLARRAQDRPPADEPPTDPSTAINQLYLFALGREPTAGETSRAVEYIVDEESWAELAQVLLLSNEFLFVD